MKTKIFALFAAMMLLVGTTAMAQSDNTSTTETEIKGDVNNDGVVDVADIAAVIAVMHEQGTVAPQYYWYVGQTMPDSVDTLTWKSSTKDAGFTETVDVLVGDTYLVIPNDWSYTAKDFSGDDFAFNAFVKPADKTKINGYVIYKIVMNGSDKVTITFSK